MKLDVVRTKFFDEKSINQKRLSCKAKLHIIDGFTHADNMEHFAKATLKKNNIISDLRMHYVDCNHIDINSKQISNIEDTLKSISNSLNRGDFLAIPGLATVSMLNLQDRIKSVLGKNLNLTPQNLKSNKSSLIEFLKEIYNYKNYYKDDISLLDKNSQDLEYTYGVINEVNKLVERGINVYIPAGHGADSTIKWFAKTKGLSDDLYRYIAKKQDPDGKIKNILNEIKEKKLYDFNLLSLCKGHIVNVKGKNNNNHIFSANDGFVNDSERGVYNFTPIRNYSGKILGYSYHDESTVEYPYENFKGNGNIANLCNYVGLPIREFYPSYDEIKTFKQYVQKNYLTTNLPDRLYPLNQVLSYQEIKNKNLDKLGYFINNKQDLIFDSNSNGKIIFHKTNCEGSEKPSVVSMFGSCFSTINAIARDLKKHQAHRQNYSYYLQKAEQNKNQGNYINAENYYNEALEILHPDKSSFNYARETINVYEKLYNLLKSNKKYSEAKGVSNVIINLKSYEIKNKSVFNSVYMKEQRNVGKFYEELSVLCEKEGEFYPAQVCKWAAKELKNNSSVADKIIQRRAEQNQYIGDLYDECH